jgi:ABC-2 type transport system permease protein
MRFSTMQFTALFKKEMKCAYSAPAFPFAVIVFLLSVNIPFFMPADAISERIFTFSVYVSRLPYIFIIILPALTMDIWTNERKNGTDMLLFSLPASDLMLAIGKFSALFTVYAGMILLVLPVLFFTGTKDAGPVFSAFLLLLLYGAASISLGGYLSACFSSSLLSFLSSITVLLVLNTFHHIPRIMELPGWLIYLCTHFSFAWHLSAAGRGILDSRDILFYVLLALAFLQANIMQLRRRRDNS